MSSCHAQQHLRVGKLAREREVVYINPEGLGVPEVIKLERRGYFAWRGLISASTWSKLFLAGRIRRIWA